MRCYPSSSGPPRGGEAGFSLLEVLVAFSILAIIAAVLLQTTATALRTATAAEQRGYATRLARSILLTVGSDVPLESGVAGQGRAGDYSWKVLIDPYVDPRLQDRDAPASLRDLTLYQVTVTVTWETARGTGGVSLASLRLGSAT